MLKIGLTGRSGSGKTTVAKHYAKLGYPVADGDEISRQIMGRGSPAVAQLADAFGKDILDETGALNRRALGRQVYLSPTGNQTLIDITHPYIIRSMLKKAKEAETAGTPLFFMDGAMIVGYALERWCDRLIVVAADDSTALQRITLRDNVPQEDATARLAAQTPNAVLKKAADYWIENNGTLDMLIQKADEVLQLLLKEGNETGKA